MKAWKIWTATVGSILIIAAGAVGVALYRNLNTEWSYQYTAAQRALNHSPISHIANHSTFTDIVSEEVFVGQDVFGRKWYAFVSGPPWTTNTVLANQVIPKSKLYTILKKQEIQPINVQLGYLNSQDNSSFTAPHHVVWEVYGKDAHGSALYIYFDGHSGKQLWKYMLST